MGQSQTNYIKYPSLIPSKDIVNEQQITDVQFTHELLQQAEFYKNVKFAQFITDFLAQQAFKSTIKAKSGLVSKHINFFDQYRIKKLLNTYDSIITSVHNSDKDIQTQINKHLDKIL